MSKQYRIAGVILSATAVIVVGVIAFVYGSGPAGAFAQGPQEVDAAAEPMTASQGASPPLGTDEIPLILTLPLEEAVSRAMQTDVVWEYDAADRVILPENPGIDYPIELADDDWRDLLDPASYYILRQKGTEPAFTHALNDNTRRGIYYSRATGQPLFHSDDKYDSRSGWPSFTKPINPDAIIYIEDNSLFMRRIEVVDSLSGSHLGHVFPDGPPPTRQRYCINGAALVFVPEGGDPPPILTAAR